MAFNLNFAQMPDFGQTMARGEQFAQQREQNALAIMMQRRQMEEQQNYSNLLQKPGVADGLMSADPATYRNALAMLSRFGGERGFQHALPLMMQERDTQAFMGGAPAPAPVQSAPARAGGVALPSGSPDVPPELMPHFIEASRETGIPVQILLAQAKQESNFNPNARGRSGEIGIMQVMPSTAQQPGYGVQPIDPARLTDPRENILFGARYLRARAGGNADMSDPAQRDQALARYNGGGDPNYAQNVTRNLPQQGGAQPASAPATSAPGGLPVVPGFDPAMVQRAQQLSVTGNQAATRYWNAYKEAAQLQMRSEGQLPRSPARFEQDRAIAEAGRPTTSVSTERTFAGQIAGKAVEQIDGALSAARTGADAVGASQRVLDVLKGGAITGTGAEWRLGLDRALATVGLIDGQRVANTEQLVTDLSKNVLAMSSALRGPTSDRDIQFLQAAAAGRISLTPETMRRIATLGAEYGRRAIDEYNEIVEPLQSDPNLPPAVRGVYRRINAPTAAAPNAPRQGGNDAQAMGEPAGDTLPTANQQQAPPRGAPPAGAVVDGYRFRGGNPNDRNAWEPVR